MKIVIIDTGCANLLSVQFALSRLGYESEISSNSNIIEKADKLLLPGVGNANFAMQNLRQRNLIDTIKQTNKPLLGICLGMQLLSNFSQEGKVDTLSVIETKVEKIPANGLPVPHMGWNVVNFLQDDVLFKEIADNSYFYFVHSYAVFPCKYTIAYAKYGKVLISAVIKKNNFYGVQFHPEKSSSFGSKILKNFIENIG